MKDTIWNDNPAEFVKEFRRLRALCQRIIDGEESIIEGSRKMLPYRSWMKEEANDVWTIFLIVDSESDHLPVGDVRALWNQQALIEKDKEIKQIEDFYRKDVQQAAAEIRAQYDKYIAQAVDEDGPPPVAQP